MTDRDLGVRVQLMQQLADDAGVIALKYFQSSTLSIETKSDASPVTEADLAIEAMIRARVLAEFPHDALLGEEHGEHAGTSGFRWVIDPIDGTVSFANGVPLFATLIAIEHGARVEAGICAMHALHERVWAARGSGAWWERTNASGLCVRTAARVRQCMHLSDALVCTTGLEYFERSNTTDALGSVAKAAARVRGWSDCYGGLLVATGRADAWIEPVMHPWDSGPFTVIFEEALGVFTDWRGDANIHGGSALACCAELHAELLRSVQSR